MSGSRVRRGILIALDVLILIFVLVVLPSFLILMAPLLWMGVPVGSRLPTVVSVGIRAVGYRDVTLNCRLCTRTLAP